MDTPGRQELQRIYEDLHEEMLMEIALNINHEYEEVAVEAARVELDKRGIEVPASHEATAADLKWFGETPSGPFIEIPRFSADEAVEIEALFTKEKIPFEKRTVAVSGDPEGGRHEYLFYVSTESFHPAVDLLKKYYAAGMEEGSTGFFSGKCPACGADLVNVEKCTDCGLTLAGDHAEFLGRHPFIRFLKNNGLLS